MNNFENLLSLYVSNENKINKYNPIGNAYYFEKEGSIKGYYWYYESKNFIIDIHDFDIYNEYIEANNSEIKALQDCFFIISTYIFSGNGEILNPYQIIEPDSIFIMDNTKLYKKYILHANSRYLAVGMKFKESIVDNYPLEDYGLKKDDFNKMFVETSKNIVKPIYKIANEIINCKFEGLSAKIFFESKANEWMSIVLDAYKNNNNASLSEEDNEAIETVAKYIENHYAFDIPQEFLEKISAMSGTKLKTLFKKRYNMSITEFTQRKRMNIAENMLLTTDLELKFIAKAVGYKSSSRFSTLYKRYKGVLPHLARKRNTF